MASGIVSKLRSIADSPDEVQVEFGVELSAEAGAIVSKAGGSCQLTVTLTWAPGETNQNR